MRKYTRLHLFERLRLLETLEYIDDMLNFEKLVKSRLDFLIIIDESKFRLFVNPECNFSFKIDT